MKNFITLSLSLFLITTIKGQVNITMTNPIVDEILKGQYNVADYAASTINNHPEQIKSILQAHINADSLKAHISQLVSFGNRNTASDTLSTNAGIGAARSYIYKKFQAFSNRNEGRLIPSYLQFDQLICGMERHKNTIAVLPGSDPGRPIIIVEGHLDSRCEAACDIYCPAEGAEDNASGTAIVIELARVLSKLSLKNTIVFMATTGEEQGLFGAEAFAQYAINQGLSIKSVFNNDVVGGIACGATSSPPSCPSENDIDSTQLRMFSSGGSNSPHKALCRFIKMQYEDEIKSTETVPMQITVMSAEDRTGRGGDHIPFRRAGFTAMRFTCANEHGNGGAGELDYHDRQHTKDDILGIDRNADGVLDSFYVDFNYLARNTKVNAIGIAMSAINLEPDITIETRKEGSWIILTINDPDDHDLFKVGYRNSGNDFDSTYLLRGVKTDTLFIQERGSHFVSVAAVDSNNIESYFSNEERESVFVLATEEEIIEDKNIELLQNKPNPFDEATIIGFEVKNPIAYRDAVIQITNKAGQIIKTYPVRINVGMNEVVHTHGYGQIGLHIYSLIIDGQIISSKKMIFAN